MEARSTEFCPSVARPPDGLRELNLSRVGLMRRLAIPRRSPRYARGPAPGGSRRTAMLKLATDATAITSRIRSHPNDEVSGTASGAKANGATARANNAGAARLPRVDP